MSSSGIHPIRMVRSLVVLLTLASQVAGSLQPATAEDTVDLAVKFPKSGQVRILAEVEHDGQVIVIPEDVKAAPKSLPMTVSGKLKYYQRITSPTQAIRYFEQAQANIKLDKGRTKPMLDAENRLIIARLKAKTGGRVEMASVKDTLQQEELELLQCPADPLSLSELFTRSKLEVGDQWIPQDKVLAKFLNVETIDTSDVKLTLKKLNKGVARVFVSGSVVASVFDVTTEISVSGIALIDVKKQQVLSLKVGTDEIRPAGQIEPGFEGRTRIDLNFQYGKSTKELTNSRLAAAIKSKKIQQRLKFVSAAGTYQIVYDPRWKLIAGEADSALMRFIDGGDLLTQCNVVLLPARPANQPLSLDHFKKEIGKAIAADKNATLIKADEKTTAHGHRALNIVVSGEEDGLPVNWFYYHVSVKDGRQITFVFTLAESVNARVKGAADQLVNEFRFTALPKKVAKRRASSPTTKPKTPPIIRKR